MSESDFVDLAPDERAAQTVRRNRAGAVVLLAATFALASTLCRHAEPNEEPAGQKAEEAPNQKAEPVQRLPVQRLAASLALDRGVRLCAQGDVGTGLLWLARCLQLAPAGADELERDARAHLAAWGSKAWPLRGVLFRARGARSVAFHPREKTILAGCGARGAVLLHTTGCLCARQPPAKPGFVAAVDFSPDGRWFLTAGADGKARLCATEAAGTVSVFTHPRPVLSVAFNPADDGATFLTGCADGKARLWRCDRVTGPVMFDHGGGLVGAVLSRDGSRVVTAAGSEARIWDRARGTVLLRLPHEGAVRALALSPSGRWLATASDGQARVWDARTGRLERQWAAGDGASALAFRHDSTVLLTGAGDRARLWDVRTGQALGPELRGESAEVVAFSPDGRLVLAGGGSGALRVWEVPPALGELGQGGGAPMVGQADRVMLWAEVVSGLRLEGDGLVARALSGAEWEKRRWELAQKGGAAGGPVSFPLLDSRGP